MIYLLEDDNSIRELVTYSLNNSGLETRGFEKPSDFWRGMEQEQPDLVLLDIKHPDPERFKIITGRDQETLFDLIDIINKHDRHVWIRNVIVPDINDTEADIEALNEFIRRINHIDKVELLGYHTMAVEKYGKLGITYRLKGVPPMDADRLAELKRLVEWKEE